jgi:hypothetical protein
VNAGNSGGNSGHGHDQNRDSVSQGDKALDRQFALVSRSAEDQTNEGHDQPTTLATTESADAKEEQVTAAAPDHHESGLTASVAARHRRSGSGNSDLFDNTDL